MLVATLSQMKQGNNKSEKKGSTVQYLLSKSKRKYGELFEENNLNYSLYLDKINCFLSKKN